MYMPGQISPAKAVARTTLGFCSASVLGCLHFSRPATPRPRRRGCQGHGFPHGSTSPHTNGSLCNHMKTCCIQKLVWRVELQDVSEEAWTGLKCHRVGESKNTHVLQTKPGRCMVDSSEAVNYILTFWSQDPSEVPTKDEALSQ